MFTLHPKVFYLLILTVTNWVSVLLTVDSILGLTHENIFIFVVTHTHTIVQQQLQLLSMNRGCTCASETLLTAAAVLKLKALHVSVSK